MATPSRCENGDGHTTLVDSLQQAHMHQAIMPNLKAHKHDFLLPDQAEVLPHQNTWLHSMQLLCQYIKSEKKSSFNKGNSFHEKCL
jgi:hypothetical protein